MYAECQRMYFFCVYMLSSAGESNVIEMKDLPGVMNFVGRNV